MIDFEKNPFFHNLLPVSYFENLCENFQLPTIKGGADPKGRSYSPSFIVMPSYEDENYIMTAFEGIETTSRYILSRMCKDTAMIKNLTPFQRLMLLGDAVYIDYWTLYINPLYNGMDVISKLYLMGLVRDPSEIPNRQVLSIEQNNSWIKMNGGKIDRRDGMVVVPYSYFNAIQGNGVEKCRSKMERMYPETYDKQMYKLTDVYSAKLNEAYPVFTDSEFLV